MFPAWTLGTSLSSIPIQNKYETQQQTYGSGILAYYIYIYYYYLLLLLLLYIHIYIYNTVSFDSHLCGTTMHRQLLEFPGKVLASGSTSSRAYYDLKPLKPRHGRPRITRRYKKAFKVPLASQSNDILSTCRFKDPVTGLMPDTVSARYFLEDVKETKDTQVTSLRGIVRFGAQATGSTLPD